MAQPQPELHSLPDPPTDGITSLAYLGDDLMNATGRHLAVSSWDGAVRIYNTTIQKLVCTQTMDAGPVLCLATPFDNSKIIFTGGLDGSVKKFDVSSSKIITMGYHSETEVPTNGDSKYAVSCVASILKDQGNGSNIIASAGWDCKFSIWDARKSLAKSVSSLKLPGKAFSIDVDPSSNANRVLVATAGRRICVIDVRATSGSTLGFLAEKVLDRESSMKYQSRAARFFPDGSGFAVGSIEGRVAIEYLDELGVDSQGKKKYAFKCHRIGETIYPVNSIAFHPKYGTFATGGCDRTVVTWDGLSKKKIFALPTFPTSIAALAFSRDGLELAIASSYTFEEGDRDHPRDEIFVREILDHEIRPKESK